MNATEPTAASGPSTTGPASFSDASLTWTDDSSSSTPSTDTPAASASADATDPPADSATADASTPATGEPPKERWDAILANARSKEREAAIAEYRQKHGWAESVNPQEFQQIQRIAKSLTGGDRIAGLQELIGELRKEDPGFDAQIRSFAARTLAQRPPTAPAVEQEPQPDLPIQLEDGRVVHLFSAEQQAKREAFLHKQWLQSVQQELQPLKQSHDEQQRAAAQAQFETAWNQWQSQTVADAVSWPGMDNAEVRAQFAREVERSIMGPQIRTVEQIERAIDRAYRTVVVPSLRQTAQSTLLDTLQRKAAASTSVNPGSAATSTPKAIHSFRDLPPEAWK